MNFRVGKYYQHSSGKKMSILCRINTTVYGNTLIAEEEDGSLKPVGDDQVSALNWHEIFRDDWLESFKDIVYDLKNRKEG